MRIFNISKYGRKGQMCLQGRLLLQLTCFFHLPVLCCVFPHIFYLPKISPSQFFFQTVTMILKENFFSLVADINGNLVSEWLTEIDISKVLFFGISWIMNWIFLFHAHMQGRASSVSERDKYISTFQLSKFFKFNFQLFYI